MRFVVFDDAPRANDRGWIADNFAAALRAPLAAIGVSVIRRRGLERNSNRGGFQARGHSAKVYRTKSAMVSDIVERTLNVNAL
jgi:hypothetical protein